MMWKSSPEREAELRREREFSEPVAKFERALASGVFPEEEVLTRLESYYGKPSDAIRKRFAVRTYSEAVKLVRREREADSEMQRVGCEYRNVAEQFAALMSASADWSEAIRTLNALNGTSHSAKLSETLTAEVIHIASSIAVANGAATWTLAYLVQQVAYRVAAVTEYTIEIYREGLSAGTNAPLGIPTLKLLQSLYALDLVKAPEFETEMAAAFSFFIEEAAKCVPNSPAVSVVKSKYLSLVAPRVPAQIEPQSAESRKAASKRGLLAVAGMSALKVQLQEEVVEVFRNPEKHKKYGIAIPNGILFFGPPGCGKTYIARQLAEELGYNYFEIIPSDVGSSYVHGTTLKIRETFEEATRKAPSILFIDEFEALVPSRDSVGSGHQYKAEEVNEFLTQMDGCSDRRVLLIAATNQPWNIDSAVQRAGRLDKKIYVAPPDRTARGEMLAHHLSGRYTSPDLDTGTVASSLSGYSSSELKLLVDEAAKLAFKADEPIGERHLLNAMKLVLPSISSEEEARYQQFAARGAASSRAKLGFS